LTGRDEGLGAKVRVGWIVTGQGAAGATGKGSGSALAGPVTTRTWQADPEPAPDDVEDTTTWVVAVDLPSSEEEVEEVTTRVRAGSSAHEASREAAAGPGRTSARAKARVARVRVIGGGVSPPAARGDRRARAASGAGDP
jgi:hypothetical protein